MAANDIGTEIHGVVLRELTADDAPAHFELIDRNREHLQRFGDHDVSGDHSADDIRKHHLGGADGGLRYGIWSHDRLAGRIDLVPVDPPHWTVGYFLDDAATGRGIATAACRALAPVARDAGAADLYAGVTLGNEKSCAVLQRAGFELIQTMPDRTRWWLPLAPDAGPPVMM